MKQTPPPPTEAQALAWLQPADPADLGEVMARANRLRQAHQGDAVELCAIVNARSGRCTEDCAFCAQSARHRTNAAVYPLLAPEEIARRAERAAAAGASRLGIVTSGRDCPDGRELDDICRAVEAIRRAGRLKPCASLGLLRPHQARRLADAGLTRYHHNLEAGPGYFPSICASHTLEERIATVRAAQAAGLEACCGGIVGMGESAAQRLELARAVAGLRPESVPLNFLSPIPGTRLEHLAPISAVEALAAVAVFKLLLPTAAVRTCGGRQAILGPLAPLMFLAGASATMTGDYLTTSGPAASGDIAMIRALGLRIIDKD